MKMYDLINPFFTKLFFYSVLTFALSCTDHNVETNLPESKCKTVNGQDRRYACEFIIEKITYLDKDGADLITFTGSEQTKSMSPAKGKSNVKLGDDAALGEIYNATFQVRLTVKRVATPAFPVNKGYILGYSYHPSGKKILRSPKTPGSTDLYGERTKIGQPIPLTMAVGESRDVLIETIIPYSKLNGIYTYAPMRGKVSFFIDNDVTTEKFEEAGEYFYVGSVVEAYFELLSIILTD